MRWETQGNDRWDLKEVRPQPCNKLWRPRGLSKRQTRNIVKSRSKPEKKPRHWKSDYERRLEPTKSAFRHALWQRLQPPKWLWKSIRRPMRSCAGLIWSCEEAYANRVGVLIENVPQAVFPTNYGQAGSTPLHSSQDHLVHWCKRSWESPKGVQGSHDGGSNVARCKVFMSTFMGTTWWICVSFLAVFVDECGSSMNCWRNKALLGVMIALEVHEKCGLRLVRPTLLEDEISED